jgi:hypothetical protein
MMIQKRARRIGISNRHETCAFVRKSTSARKHKELFPWFNGFRLKKKASWSVGIGSNASQQQVRGETAVGLLSSNEVISPGSSYHLAGRYTLYINKTRE